LVGEGVTDWLFFLVFAVCYCFVTVVLVVVISKTMELAVKLWGRMNGYFPVSYPRVFNEKNPGSNTHLLPQILHI